MTALVVTATGTGVGKTVVAAGLVALAEGATYVKAAQTGVPPDPADADEVARLTGAATWEGARYPEPLAPETAARRAGLPPVDFADVAAYVGSREGPVVVEGAGGLLVRYDPQGRTLADLARALDAPVLVVVSSGLGTLNTTALTLEAIAARGLSCAGVVVGSWPVNPGLADRTNVADLESLAGAPLAGAFPFGAGALDRTAFREVAARSLSPAYGGTFDATAFREGVAP